MKKITSFLLILITLFLISGCTEKIKSPELKNELEISNKEPINQKNPVEEPIREIEVEKEVDSKRKFFDWNVWLVGCSGCDNSEIVNFRDKILLALPEREYQFDGYSMIVNHVPTKFNDLSENYTINGIYLNLTYGGNKKLNELNLGEYGVGTVYFNRIIDKSIQAEPKNDTELRYCEEERECIMVGTNCCASSNCGYTAINRKYHDYWNSQFNCSGIGCTANICMKSFSVRCLNNQCNLI